MGVQYAIHLLKELPNRECSLASRTSLANNRVVLERRDNKSAEGETQELDGWMDAQCSMDYVRRTMLGQEKMFNEQVLELHRLYHVQKSLMSELSKGVGSISTAGAAVSSSVASDAKSGLWSSTSDCRANLLSSLLTTDSTGGSAQMGRCYSVDMESRVVLPSSTVQGAPHPIYEEHNRLTGEEIDDSDLDLTLRIGSSSCSRAKARRVEAGGSGSKDVRVALAFTSTHGMMPWKKDHAHAGHVISFHTPRAAGLQSPSWLPQALSLNRT